MRAYDPEKPLIFIHVPKSAGTAVGAIVEEWFPGRFHQNYFDEKRGTMPPVLPDAVLNDASKPPVIYGHFNKYRGFGITDYYPIVSQFVTILRDPFESMVSFYYYTRKVGRKWKDKSRIPAQELSEFLKTQDANMLNHFPREMDISNYREIIDEYFVEIGVTEHLDPSLHRIAASLGRSYEPKQLTITNATPRDQPVPPGCREDFIETHPLEYAVYEYARSRLGVS